MIVANHAVTLQNFVNHLLTIQAIFQSLTHIDIIERRLVGQHWECVVHVASHFKNLNVWIGAQQWLGLKVNTVHRIHLTRHQSIHPRGRIIDRDTFNLIKPTCTAIFIMAVHTGEHAAHAWIEANDFIKPCANAFSNGFVNHSSRIHQDMIIRQQEWEISVASSQSELDLVIIHLFHSGDRSHDRFRSRFRTFLSVHIQRCNNIVRTKGFAVVKRHTFAQVKRPCFSI